MEQPQQPAPSDFARELKYQKAMREHLKNFDTLLAAIPKNRPDIKGAIQLVYSVSPDTILDREKLQKLKGENEPLFREVTGFYMNFLEKVLKKA